MSIHTFLVPRKWPISTRPSASALISLSWEASSITFSSTISTSRSMYRHIRMRRLSCVMISRMQRTLRASFSGLKPDHNAYDSRSWQYKLTKKGESREPTEEPSCRITHPKKGATDIHDEQNIVPDGQDGQGLLAHAHPSQIERDETMQHPRCVLQIMKRHYARYTPEVVEQICGIPQHLFFKIADTLVKNSGRERTTNISYAVGWTQHTTGVQMIRAGSILQLLLGNIGRPGGGILALRGHANIQGSTDIATLYNLLPGYLVT